MTKAETDILKKALFIAGRQEIEAYKALPDEEVLFSKEFEEKVRAINKRRKSLFYKATKTVPRRIAVILIAAIIAITMVVSVSAICIPPVLSFLVDIHDTFINISFEGTAPDTPTNIEHMYVPSYIPDGYIEIESENYNKSATSIWMKDSDMIILTQNTISEGTQISIDNEGVDYKTIWINTNKIYYYNKDGYYYMIWDDRGYIYTLTYPENIPLDEIRVLITSMKIKK